MCRSLSPTPIDPISCVQMVTVHVNHDPIGIRLNPDKRVWWVPWLLCSSPPAVVLVQVMATAADKKRLEQKQAAILNDLLARPENKVCADCGEKGMFFLFHLFWGKIPFQVPYESSLFPSPFFTRSSLGVMEHWLLPVPSLRRCSPSHGCAHLKGQVGHARHLDRGAARGTRQCVTAGVVKDPAPPLHSPVSRMPCSYIDSFFACSLFVRRATAL